MLYDSQHSVEAAAAAQKVSPLLRGYRPGTWATQYWPNLQFGLQQVLVLVKLL